MNITFDVNFWSLCGVLIAFYSVLAGRSRASANELEKVKGKIAEVKSNQADTNARMGERLQALETKADASISHEDLDALRKLHDDRITLVHRRVDDLHSMFADIKQDIGEMKGILRQAFPPR